MQTLCMCVETSNRSRHPDPRVDVRHLGAFVITSSNRSWLVTPCPGRTEKLGHLFSLVDEGIRLARETNPGVKLEARWIPGHKGVDGNERADKAAKLAATRGNDTHILLPDSMKKRIPVNPTAAKRTRKARMEEEWKEWAAEEGDAKRTQHMRTIDDTYPSMQFWKLADGLTRLEYATLTQLRTGHFPTSTYLYRSTLADSPRCPHCETQNETVLHLLTGCKAHEGYRRERDQAMGAASRYVKFLLKPGEHTKHLMEYLRKARGLTGGQAPHGAERREGG